MHKHKEIASSQSKETMAMKKWSPMPADVPRESRGLAFVVLSLWKM